jgi:hypothetical protein
LFNASFGTARSLLPFAALQSGLLTLLQRNGTIGPDFSTKLSAWLALGCVTARQIHEYLLAFEDGTTALAKGTHGYGKGENKVSIPSSDLSSSTLRYKTPAKLV